MGHPILTMSIQAEVSKNGTSTGEHNFEAPPEVGDYITLGGETARVVFREWVILRAEDRTWLPGRLRLHCEPATLDTEGSAS